MEVIFEIWKENKIHALFLKNHVILTGYSFNFNWKFFFSKVQLSIQ